jgi:hypothetical protein
MKIYYFLILPSAIEALNQWPVSSGQYPVESEKWKAIEIRGTIASSRTNNFIDIKFTKNFIPGLPVPKVST